MDLPEVTWCRHSSQAQSLGGCNHAQSVLKTVFDPDVSLQQLNWTKDLEGSHLWNMPRACCPAGWPAALNETDIMAFQLWPFPLTCVLFQDVYPKGVIPLAAIQMARPAKDNKFEIVTSHRIFVFRTDTEGKCTQKHVRAAGQPPTLLHSDTIISWIYRSVHQYSDKTRPSQQADVSAVTNLTAG